MSDEPPPKKPTKPAAPRRVSDDAENARRAEAHAAAMAEWELQMAAHRETMATRKRKQDKASRPTDDGARAVKRRQGSASSSAAHAAREARRSAAALAATPQGQLRLAEQERVKGLWEPLLAQRMRALIAMEGLHWPAGKCPGTRFNSDAHGRLHFRERQARMGADAVRLIAKLLYDDITSCKPDGTARYEDEMEDVADEFVMMQQITQTQCSKGARFSAFVVSWLQYWTAQDWDKALETELAPQDTKLERETGAHNCPFLCHWQRVDRGHVTGLCCRSFKDSCQNISGERIHAWLLSQGEPLTDAEDDAEWDEVTEWLRGNCALHPDQYGSVYTRSNAYNMLQSVAWQGSRLSLD